MKERKTVEHLRIEDGKIEERLVFVYDDLDEAREKLLSDLQVSQDLMDAEIAKRGIDYVCHYLSDNKRVVDIYCIEDINGYYHLTKKQEKELGL